MHVKSLQLLSLPALALAFLAVACGAEPEVAEPGVVPKAVAEEMVVGELATTVGLGPLVASCSDLGVATVGSTFTCTATTEPGDVIDVAGTINGEGHIELVTTNLVSAAALPAFERDAAAILNSTVGSNFTADSVDCGATAVVLAADFVLPCALVMPASGEVFDLTLTVTDLDARTFSLVVAEEPRA